MSCHIAVYVFETEGQSSWLIVFAISQCSYSFFFVLSFQPVSNGAQPHRFNGTFIKKWKQAWCRCYACRKWLLPLSQKMSQLELWLFISRYISLVINCNTHIWIISAQERAFLLCEIDIKEMQIDGVLGTKHMLPQCQQACPWQPQLGACKTCSWQKTFFSQPLCKWTPINTNSIQF